ncbi:hypothetical protein ACFOY4_41460 [Actinomadura syzygii]|uniref:Uncharacterized protein n=1 Tax=Actinomadura syzygii TaxID=1427538 RepID=A0A5D0TN93_9ACTN|nr:hypothetical protein [Actinomadura syzygii]TYC07588.1 hypothetical protein FXF65_42055 [Actinomadura syzygii]
MEPDLSKYVVQGDSSMYPTKGGLGGSGGDPRRPTLDGERLPHQATRVRPLGDLRPTEGLAEWIHRTPADAGRGGALGHLLASDRTHLATVVHEGVSRSKDGGSR